MRRRKRKAVEGNKRKRGGGAGAAASGSLGVVVVWTVESVLTDRPTAGHVAAVAGTPFATCRCETVTRRPGARVQCRSLDHC